MDLSQYARVLRAHWLWVVISVVVCAGAAAAIASKQGPTYEARTQLFVSSARPGADLSQAYQGGLLAQQLARSYAQLVTSPAVTGPVIERLGLRETPGQLASKLSATVPLDTVLIDVAVEDESPRRAAAIADAVDDELPRVVSGLDSAPQGRGSRAVVRVASPPQVPTSASGPSKSIYLALGLLLGLAVGVALALLRHLLDSRVRTGEDAVAITGAPIIAGVSENPRVRSDRLTVAAHPGSRGAESYRRLRATLSNLYRGEGAALVVTSAVAAEGKTAVAANLSIAFAEASYRTVVVDANLRRPRLADALGVSGGAGLTDVLEHHVTLVDALQIWREDLPLEVLPAGPPSLQPSELLGSPRFAAILQTLKERADVVILDAPALLHATDAAILAPLAGGALLVTRLGSPRAEELDAAADDLAKVGADVVGLVLNRPTWPWGSARLSSRRASGASVPVPVATDAPLRVPTAGG
jgi:capsular exopolysaccharide synthesis family protein